VAVKNLPADNIEQAYSEIEILHFLGKHKHITQMIGAYTQSRRAWIVLELCEGGDVFEYFQSHPLEEEPLREAMNGIFSALEFCHS
jgi:serine/threonine protein kinase